MNRNQQTEAAERYKETHHASERRVMYRCAACKTAKRVDMAYSYTETQRFDQPYPTTHSHRWNTPATETAAGKIYRGKQAPAIACQTCGDYMTGKPIPGPKNPAIKCGSKCRNAKGGECECECGGEHHGAGHS